MQINHRCVLFSKVICADGVTSRLTSQLVSRKIAPFHGAKQAKLINAVARAICSSLIWLKLRLPEQESTNQG